MRKDCNHTIKIVFLFLSGFLINCSAPLPRTLQYNRLKDPLSTKKNNQSTLPQKVSWVERQHCPTVDLQRLNLSDSLQVGLCHSPEAKAAFALTQKALANVGQAKADYLPTIQASYGYTQKTEEITFQGKQKSYQSSQNPQELIINLEWEILDFGRRRAEKEKNLAMLSSLTAQYNEVLQRQWAEIAQIYINTLFLKQSVDLANENHQHVSQNAQLVKAFYQNGIAIRADLEQAQVEVYQAKLAQLKAQEKYAKAKGALAQKLGLHPTVSIGLANFQDSILLNKKKIKNIKKLMQIMEDKHPTIIAAKSRLLSQKAQLAVIENSYLPSVHLLGQYSREDNLNSIANEPYQKEEGLIGLKVRFPIFTGFRHQYAIESAAAEKAHYAAQLHKITDQVTLALWNAWQQWNASIEQYSVAEKAVGAAQINYHSQQGKYREGIGELQDLLAAQKQLNEVKQAKLDAIIAWHEAKINLLLSLGYLDKMPYFEELEKKIKE